MHAVFLFAILFPLTNRLGILRTHDMYTSVTETFVYQQFTSEAAPDGTSNFAEMNTIDDVYAVRAATALRGAPPPPPRFHRAGPRT